MLTDEMVDAIDIMIDLCSSKEQALGMASVREMLCDFDEANWIDIVDTPECHDWLANYLSCKRKNLLR